MTGTKSFKELIVGVQFSRVGKIYHFDGSHISDLKVRDYVIVDTNRGNQVGQVIEIVSDPEKNIKGKRKPVLRVATPRDLVLRQSLITKQADVLIVTQEKVHQLRMTGLKVVSAEFDFDGDGLTVLISNDSEDRIDVKPLRQLLQEKYSPTQVEVRQIGPRDAAKIMGGMGVCGLETRCCSKYLTDFCSISIRMAKDQGVSLTPTEITGMCGRLRCCLIYEHEQYVEALKELPKRNKRVMTPNGEGKVSMVIPLKGTIIVDLPETGPHEFPKEDVHLISNTDKEKEIEEVDKDK